jgi:hypothetical protein
MCGMVKPRRVNAARCVGLVRPGCKADTPDGMPTKALMPRCLGPVVGRHGEVAKRSGVVQHATFRMATVAPPSAEA